MSFKLDYRPLAGESYRRCNQVIIDNPYDGAPSITFAQETIFGAGGAVMHMPMSGIRVDFDPAAEIAVVDPTTGEPTGQTITHAALYAMIYSAFVAALAPAPIAEETPE
jgi:hypothetical protein